MQLYSLLAREAIDLQVIQHGIATNCAAPASDPADALKHGARQQIDGMAPQLQQTQSPWVCIGGDSQVSAIATA